MPEAQTRGGPSCFLFAFICGHSCSSSWEEGPGSSCLPAPLYLLINCLQHTGTSTFFVTEDCQLQAACQLLWKHLFPIKTYSTPDMGSTFLYFSMRWSEDHRGIISYPIRISLANSYSTILHCPLTDQVFPGSRSTTSSRLHRWCCNPKIIILVQMLKIVEEDLEIYPFCLQFPWTNYFKGWWSKFCPDRGKTASQHLLISVGFCTTELIQYMDKCLPGAGDCETVTSLVVLQLRVQLVPPRGTKTCQRNCPWPEHG